MMRLAVALIAVMIIAGCGSGSTTLEQMGWKADDILKVEVRCGTSGQNWLVDEEELVEQIALLVTGMELKTGDNTPYSGYSYSLDLHSGDKKTVSVVVAGNRVVVDGRQYWTEQGIDEELTELTADL